MNKYSGPSPFSYSPIFDKSIERDEWVKAQRTIDAAQYINEIELEGLVKFDLIRWLGF